MEPNGSERYRQLASLSRFYSLKVNCGNEEMDAVRERMGIPVLPFFVFFKARRRLPPLGRWFGR